MDRNETKDETLYTKGFHAGMKMVRNDISSYIQGMLMKLYELARKQPEDADNNEAILVVSSIYSYIYGTDKLFIDMYRKGVLLTEPEMMFGRVANKKESLLPLDELRLQWLNEMMMEKKDSKETDNQ